MTSHAAVPHDDVHPGVDVIVCTHRLDRLGLLQASVAAIRVQLTDTDRCTLVVDGGADLLARVDDIFGSDPRVQVVQHRGEPGLSAARNAGVAASDRPLVAFVDDDAVPAPDWLSRLRQAFAGAPDQIVGGGVEPDWAGRGAAPGWFPAEFGWAVGCDYAGMPPHGALLRNPIGANMAAGRRVIERSGGFDVRLGRRHRGLAGAEETEFAVRAVRLGAAERVVRVADARVAHRVPPERQRLSYLLRRCFDEGRSKARLARVAGTGSLGPEGAHAMGVLPRAWQRDVLRGPGRWPRVFVSMLALLATVAGFAVGQVIR